MSTSRSSPLRAAGYGAPVVGEPEGHRVDGTVGARLRQLRKERSVTAQDLAAAAKVSPAYLSRLEHGRFSPTVATLTRIVHALGVSVAQVFGDADSGPVVRLAERRSVQHHGVRDTILTPSRATRLEVLETVVDPGASSGEEPYDHPGDEESVVVLEGRLLIWLGDQRHELAHGDAITFPCRTPHRWANPTDDTVRLLWVITPARY